MSAMEIGFIMALQGFFCVSCFVIGARVGQKVIKGESVDIGLKNPIEAYDEYKEKEEQKRMLERQQVVSDNIDNYDGTGLGQKDLPEV